jgi:hypothetical protein
MQNDESEFAKWFLLASDELKNTERLAQHLVIPAVNELRFAGHNLARAIQAKDVEEKRQLTRRAKRHCILAFRDAVEARALFALSWFSDLRRSHLEPSRSLAKNARELATIVQSFTQEPTTERVNELRVQTDRLLLALQTGGFPERTASHSRLQVFLCHGAEDKPWVRKLYDDLALAGYAPWLDEKDILPGQDWRLAVESAVKRSDVVLVCLSRQSVSKRGYIQKEIAQALDVAQEQPEGAIFLIPVRIERCDVPARLSAMQWVDHFAEDGRTMLERALQAAASQKLAGNLENEVRGDFEHLVSRARELLSTTAHDAVESRFIAEGNKPDVARAAVADALRNWRRR